MSRYIRNCKKTAQVKDFFRFVFVREEKVCGSRDCSRGQNGIFRKRNAISSTFLSVFLCECNCSDFFPLKNITLFHSVVKHVLIFLSKSGLYDNNTTSVEWKEIVLLLLLLVVVTIKTRAQGKINLQYKILLSV